MERPQRGPDGRENKSRSFWDFFALAENGKLKSTVLINSFALSLLYLAVYILSYSLLLGPVDAMIDKQLPVFWINCIESVIPAAAATALCLTFFLFSRDKRVVPAAYVWLLIFSLILLIALFFALGPEDRPDFAQLYAMFVPAPLLIGCGSSAAIYLRYRKQQYPN
jgi:hypothetical protein